MSLQTEEVVTTYNRSQKMSSLPLLRFSFRPIPLAKLSPPSPSRLPYKSTLHLSPRHTRNKTPLNCHALYSPTPATDRLISAIAYTLPFFNGIQYGRYLFHQYPRLAFIIDPIIPILNTYRSLPYASFVAFFALYLGVVRNPNLSRFVRFNSMQAVVLDVLLVLPLLVQKIFGMDGGVGLRVMMNGYNVIFVGLLVCWVYSVGCCVVGRTPVLPFVAEAAGRQL